MVLVALLPAVQDEGGSPGCGNAAVSGAEQARWRKCCPLQGWAAAALHSRRFSFSPADTMPVLDPRGDAGRWANATYRVRHPSQPEPQPRRKKRSWFTNCCRCCSGQGDDGDWGPAPGEVPGARRPDPVIRGESRGRATARPARLL